MRNLINIVENIKADPIDAMIKASKFTVKDINDGTAGLCGTFAIVLWRLLKSRNIPAQLYFFSEEGTIETWRHVVVKVGDNFYDIRGKVTKEEVEKEFYTPFVSHITEPELEQELRHAYKQDDGYWNSKYKRRHNRWDKKITNKRLEVVNEISMISHSDGDDDYYRSMISSLYKTRADRLNSLTTISNLQVMTADFTMDSYRSWFFFIRNDEPVGGACLQYSEPKTTGSFFVKMIWLEPEYRSKGIALEFYKYLLDSGITLTTDTRHTVYSKALWNKLSNDTAYDVSSNTMNPYENDGKMTAKRTST